MKNLLRITLILLALVLISLFAFGQEVPPATDYLYGGLAPEAYKFAFIFAGVGIFIRWYITTRRGIRRSKRTPQKFNLWYWLRDNILKKLLTILGTTAVIFIFLRFSVEFFGKPASMFLSFLIGLFLDYLIDYLDKLRPDVMFSQKNKISED